MRNGEINLDELQVPEVVQPLVKKRKTPLQDLPSPSPASSKRPPASPKKSAAEGVPRAASKRTRQPPSPKPLTLAGPPPPPATRRRSPSTAKTRVARGQPPPPPPRPTSRVSSVPPPPPSPRKGPPPPPAAKVRPLTNPQQNPSTARIPWVLLIVLAGFGLFIFIVIAK